MKIKIVKEKLNDTSATLQQINREAIVMQSRVERRRLKGVCVTADQLWQWIDERVPHWSEQDRERVFQFVRL